MTVPVVVAWHHGASVSWTIQEEEEEGWKSQGKEVVYICKMEFFISSFFSYIFCLFVMNVNSVLSNFVILYSRGNLTYNSLGLQ